MPATSVTVTETREVRLEPRLKKKLQTALKQYQAIKQQLEAVQHALDKQKDVIGSLRDETGETSIALDGFKITLVAGVTSKLDVKKLIANGVTQGQIKMSTVTKPSKPYTKISMPSSREEEE